MRKMNIGKITCKCPQCNCKEEFEPLTTGALLNSIQHGRLNQEQIKSFKNRVGSTICESCFLGKHNG